MYPSKETLEQRRLTLSQMENALLEQRLQINIKLSQIETEKTAIDLWVEK